MVQVTTAAVAARLTKTRVLVVDDDSSTRKLVKTLLTSMGVADIFEAGDGMVGLELVQKVVPDVVILDWQMPRLQGPNFMRIVRSPDTFPLPAVPVIMLTGHGEYSKVKEAISVGVNEFLLKPVSSRGLLDRMMAVLFNPRPMIRKRDYYGPELRTASQLLRSPARDESAEWTVEDVLMI
jgi:two-component system, chemotaxis family, chemotaxis protein CheY